VCDEGIPPPKQAISKGQYNSQETKTPTRIDNKRDQLSSHAKENIILGNWLRTKELPKSNQASSISSKPFKTLWRRSHKLDHEMLPLDRFSLVVDKQKQIQPRSKLEGLVLNILPGN